MSEHPANSHDITIAFTPGQLALIALAAVVLVWLLRRRRQA
jgi:MYXO-CTERM domain-containing protein